MDYREYEIEEDGTVYVIREYSCGAVVKTVKGDGAVTEPTLPESEQRELEMAANIEYAVQLLEMSMEG